MRKILPIGKDDFRKLREEDSFYYVDKSLMIKDFINLKNEVALITRPRRFGKTLNMSMISEFFDLTKDSKQLFHGLAIMDTDYSELINSKPVIYLSFKDCSGMSAEELRIQLITAIFPEYRRYFDIFNGKVNRADYYYSDYFRTLEDMDSKKITLIELAGSIYYLMTAITKFFSIKPILLIDEYDQPIISSYENGYRKDIGSFFESFYGLALKGNEYLSGALLTGIQRVAKESIFSKLNNVIVYTVLDKIYSPYFGLNTTETSTLLEYYNLELNDEVKKLYNGYKFGDAYMYNPSFILNYAHKRILSTYWINTSSNRMIRNAISSSGSLFQREFDLLLSNHRAIVSAELETSFIELKNSETLWGLLINAGYLTVLNRKDIFNMTVAMPNDEVRYEFQKLIAEQANISGHELTQMFQALLDKDIEQFFYIYSNIVLSCTSFFDAKENAYHMLFLGMCISLKELYRITSNIESGHGRSDITLESLSKERFHIIIEFKQGDNIKNLKIDALNQILDNRYYTGLSGKVLCLGIAHNGKHCEIEHKMIQV